MDKKDIQREINKVDKEINLLYQKREKLIYESNRIHQNDTIDKYLRTYDGKALMKNYKLEEVAVWDIFDKIDEEDYKEGEEYVLTKITSFEGTLENAILLGIEKNNFLDWYIVKAK